MTQDYYQQFNVTRWLPSFNELKEMYIKRANKASKTRFINESLKDASETRIDLVNALQSRFNGKLHGATHTWEDLATYDRYIKNIENLKNL